MTSGAHGLGYSGGMTLMPAAPGTCAQCATTHAEDEPHNAQSLHYQYWFYGTHGRWPNWDDALAHCDDAMQRKWRKELVARGVKVGLDPVSTREVARPGLPRVLLITCGKWRRAYPMKWLPAMYFCDGKARAAWGYPGVLTPEGCADVEFFRRWLARYLYTLAPGSGKLRVGRRTIRVEVLNGSVFEET